MKQGSESAAAENVGIILIVAVTVILAAIIAAYASGLTENVHKTYSVMVTVGHEPGGAAHVTYQGGPDHQYLTDMAIAYDDGTRDTWTGPYTVGDTAPVRAGERHVIVVGKFNAKDDQVLLNAMI